MTIRTRLMTGLAAFVVALVGLGALSAWHLWQMSALSERIMSENYNSVVAAGEMKESLERQDSAGLFALLDRWQTAQPQLQQHRTLFDDAYRRAAANITEEGEAEIVVSIGKHRDEYYAAFDRFLKDARQTGAAGRQPALAIDEYFRTIEPLFAGLRSRCNRLLTLNQDAMRRKAARAATLARRWFLSTLATAVTLVVGGLAFAIVLSNGIVRPIRQLTDATSRMAAGDLATIVDITSGDELGVLAARFNEMAARIRELRETDLGNVLVARQTAEAAMDSLYDPVIVIDGARLVRRLNRAAEPLFGVEAAVVGRPVEDVIRDPRLTMAALDVLESRRTVAAEESAAFVPLVVDGVERAFRQRTTPMRDADGRPLGAVMLLEDITHLREIDRLKSEFVAGASHELRTPLTSLEMGVHLLLEGAAGSLSAKQREILTMCRDDATRLDSLVKELLDLSRLESGRVAAQLAPVHAEDMLTAAVEGLRRQADSKGVALHVRAPADLPVLFADAAQVQRVITNLVSNAIRATDTGGEIEIAAVRREGYVAISVRDTGCGIPQDYLSRIFEPFVQVPRAPSGGAGLGLSISRRIVEAHGGQITVRSDPGQGATFTFTLPLSDASGRAPERVG